MSADAGRIVVADATCLACGCLCDDVNLAVEAARIVAAENACPIGRAWFLADYGRDGRPAATIAGEPAEPAEAIARAAEILGAARAPLVLGLVGTSIEAQAAAVALADRIGATIDPGSSAESGPRVRAESRVGRVSATWGEVRHRADVVVFWGVDPDATHPRLWDRHAVAPRGRFVPDGRAGRWVAVVDETPGITAGRADAFLRIGRDDQGPALATLRGLVRGLDEAPVGDEWRVLADRMGGARYGAFFFGPGLGRARGGAAVVEEALRLVRDLNQATRFVALGLGGPGNPAGAEAALTWQAGAPIAIDFGRGYPRSLPDEATAEARLAAREADAALIVADEPTGLSPGARAHLARIPVVRVAPDATAPGRSEAVALACAWPGIHAGGTVLRSDGIALPLRPALASDRPTDRAILGAILGRLSP